MSNQKNLGRKSIFTHGIGLIEGSFLITWTENNANRSCFNDHIKHATAWLPSPSGQLTTACSHEAFDTGRSPKISTSTPGEKCAKAGGPAGAITPEALISESSISISWTSWAGYGT